MNTVTTKKIYVAVIGLFLFMPLCATDLIQQIRAEKKVTDDIIKKIEKTDAKKLSERDEYGLTILHYIIYRHRHRVDVVKEKNVIENIIQKLIESDKSPKRDEISKTEPIKPEEDVYLKLINILKGNWSNKTYNLDLIPKKHPMEKLAKTLDKTALKVYEHLNLIGNIDFIETLKSALVKDLKTLDVGKINRGLEALPDYAMKIEVIRLLIEITSMNIKFLDENFDKAIKMMDMLVQKANDNDLEDNTNIISTFLNNAKTNNSFKDRTQSDEQIKNVLEKNLKNKIKQSIISYGKKKDDYDKAKHQTYYNRPDARIKFMLNKYLKNSEIKINPNKDLEILEFSIFAENLDIMKTFMKKETIKKFLASLTYNKTEKLVRQLLTNLTSMDGTFLDNNLNKAIEMTDVLFQRAKSFGLEDDVDFMIKLAKNTTKKGSVTYEKQFTKMVKAIIKNTLKYDLKMGIFLYEIIRFKLKKPHKDKELTLNNWIKNLEIKIDPDKDFDILKFALISEDSDVFKNFMRKKGITKETIFMIPVEHNKTSHGLNIKDYAKELHEKNIISNERFEIVLKQIESERMPPLDGPIPRRRIKEFSEETKRNLNIFLGAFVVTVIIVAAYKTRHRFLKFLGISSKKDNLSKKELDAIVSYLTNAKQNMTKDNYKEYKTKILSALSYENAKKVMLQMARIQ